MLLVDVTFILPLLYSLSLHFRLSPPHSPNTPSAVLPHVLLAATPGDRLFTFTIVTTAASQRLQWLHGETPIPPTIALLRTHHCPPPHPPLPSSAPTIALLRTHHCPPPHPPLPSNFRSPHPSCQMQPSSQFLHQRALIQSVFLSSPLAALLRTHHCPPTFAVHIRLVKCSRPLNCSTSEHSSKADPTPFLPHPTCALLTRPPSSLPAVSSFLTPSDRMPAILPSQHHIAAWLHGKLSGPDAIAHLCSPYNHPDLLFARKRQKTPPTDAVGTGGVDKQEAEAGGGALEEGHGVKGKEGGSGEEEVQLSAVQEAPVEGRAGEDEGDGASEEQAKGDGASEEQAKGDGASEEQPKGDGASEEQAKGDSSGSGNETQVGAGEQCSERGAVEELVPVTPLPQDMRVHTSQSSSQSEQHPPAPASAPPVAAIVTSSKLGSPVPTKRHAKGSKGSRMAPKRRKAESEPHWNAQQQSTVAASSLRDNRKRNASRLSSGSRTRGVNFPSLFSPSFPQPSVSPRLDATCQARASPVVKATTASEGESSERRTDAGLAGERPAQTARGDGSVRRAAAESRETGAEEILKEFSDDERATRERSAAEEEAGLEVEEEEEDSFLAHWSWAGWVRDVVELRFLEDETALRRPMPPLPPRYAASARASARGILAGDAGYVRALGEVARWWAESWRVQLQYEYDPADVAHYFNRRPHIVLLRTLKISVLLAATWVQVARDTGAIRAREAGGVSAGDERIAAIRQHSALKLKRTLLRLGPTFIKVAQSLSARPDVVGPDTAKVLAELQDRLPAFPSEDAMAVIERELGRPAATLFPLLSPTPVAAASFGQVYKGRTRDGMRVAVKVQRPRVLFLVARDIHILRMLLRAVRRVAGINTDLAALADEFGRGLYGELDYRLEANNATLFAKAHAHLPGITVPAIRSDLTSRRVLTMEWVEGERTSDLLAQAQGVLGAAGGEEARQRAKQKLLRMVGIGVESSLEQLLVTGVLHADPHPGNLLLTPHGQVAYLDFGLLCRMERQHQQAMLAAVAHLVNGEWSMLAADLAAMDVLKPTTDRRALTMALEEAFGRGRQRGAASGGAPTMQFGQVTSELWRMALRFRFRLPPYYTLVLRSLASLEGASLTLPVPCHSSVHHRSPYPPTTLSCCAPSPPLKVRFALFLPLPSTPRAATALPALYYTLPLTTIVFTPCLVACPMATMTACPSPSFPSTAMRVFASVYHYATLLSDSPPMPIRLHAGIGVAVDPSFRVFASAYPYVVRRLLTDSSPSSRHVLRQLVQTREGKLRWERFASFAASSTQAQRYVVEARVAAQSEGGGWG
ncbi:unnamed protein product [Closterium sp. NIES-54]